MLTPAVSAQRTRTANVATPLRRSSRVCIVSRSYLRVHVRQSAGACFNRDMGEDPVAPLREPPIQAVETVGDAIVVRLAGELDLYNAEDVRGALAGAAAAAPRLIVVDLTQVEFVDSTALG